MTYTWTFKFDSHIAKGRDILEGLENVLRAQEHKDAETQFDDKYIVEVREASMYRPHEGLFKKLGDKLVEAGLIEFG